MIQFLQLILVQPNEVLMSQEAKIQHYRGVLCGYCRQPIPLPGIVERSTAQDSDPASHDRVAHAFNLRCRACEREKPYRRSDISEFEGTPRPRFSRAVTPGPIHQRHKVARAANG
jgi:hypothetical protein